MKSIRSILILSVAVMSIIMFWLMPGINSAKNVEYVRRYEDTDYRRQAQVVGDTINKKLNEKQESKAVKQVREKKVYKEERISTKDKLSKITPKKFSRAAHFEEMIRREDSIKQVADKRVADTTKIVQ